MSEEVDALEGWEHRREVLAMATSMTAIGGVVIAFCLQPLLRYMEPQALLVCGVILAGSLMTLAQAFVLTPNAKVTMCVALIGIVVSLVGLTRIVTNAGDL